MAALHRTDNRTLFRENLADISPLSTVDPFNINIVQYNAGNRIDLTDTPFMDDAIRRALGPAAFMHLNAKEEEEKEIAEKTFRFYLDGGELANMQRVMNENSPIGDSLRQIEVENETRRERQAAEIRRQAEIAEHNARQQAAQQSSARENKTSVNPARSTLSRAFSAARTGVAQAGDFVGDRIEDVQDFAGSVSRKAARVADDIGDAAVDTGKTAIRTGVNAFNNAAQAVDNAADRAGNAISNGVSGALSRGSNLIARFSPFD